MKLIFINGPSGSGKTTLSKKILREFENSIILSTDNYYKTGIISKILSKFIDGYFDRKISFNYKLLKEDLNFIINNGESIYEYKYNFDKKNVKKSLNKKSNINYLIVEGIFAEELFRKFLNNFSLLIELKTKKNTCMKRVILRDVEKRGKSKESAKRDFLKSWKIFYKNKKIHFPLKNITKITFTDKTDFKKVYEEIINLKN